MLFWLDSEYTTNAGPNTPCSPCSNRAPSSVSLFTESSPGNGPLRLDATGRRGTQLLSWQNAQTLQLIDTAVNTLFSGAAKDFELCWVFQPTSTQASYEGGAGNTTNFVDFFYLLRDSIQQLFYWRSADPSNPDTVTPLLTTPQGMFPITLRLTHTAATHLLQMTIDHVPVGPPISFPWSNSSAKNIYTIGSIRTTVNSIQGYLRIRHHMLYGKAFTPTDGLNFDNWAANEIGTNGVRLNWKGGYTQSATFGRGTNTTHVVAICGDSQGTAYACTEFYVSKYAGTSDQAYALFPDGNVAPMTGTPLNDPTDAMPMIQDSAPSGTMDAWTRAADYLIDNGPATNNLFMNSCLASCLVQGTSGIMLNSGLTAVPPPIDQPYGRLWYYLTEVLKAPNVDLVFYVLNGEPHAAEPPFQGATVANLVTGLHAFLDRLNVVFAPFFTKTIHFIIGQPPVTPATDYAAHWPEMRQAIADVVAARPDCLMTTYPNGPRDAQMLHIINGVNTPGAETGKLGIGVGFAMADLARV